MRVGVMWGSFMRHQKLGLVGEGHDLIRKAREYGFDSYLLSAGRELPSLEPADLREGKGLLDELGMTCTLNSGLLRRVREGDEDAVRRTFEAAKFLDAHSINMTFSPGMNTRWKEGWDEQTASEYVKRDTEDAVGLAEFAEEYEVPVAIENHLDYILGEIGTILDAVPSDYVGLNFDTANPLLFLQSPMDFVRRFAGRIFSTHLKDGYILPDPDGARVVWCNIGEGIVDIPGILSVLNDQDRETALNLEYWAQAAHEVPYETEAYWDHLLLSREEAAPMRECFEQDLAKGRPELSSDDHEGLEDEIRVMKSVPGYVRELWDELD